MKNVPSGSTKFRFGLVKSTLVLLSINLTVPFELLISILKSGVLAVPRFVYAANDCTALEGPYLKRINIEPLVGIDLVAVKAIVVIPDSLQVTTELGIVAFWASELIE
jgi:hypothetical protein